VQEQKASLRKLFVVVASVGLTLEAGTGRLLAAPFQAPKTLVSITVGPDHALVAPGKTQQFKATAKYSDGSTENLTSATWNSSEASVAGIGPTGLATGTIPGQTTIVASSGAIKSAPATLVVGPLDVPIKITPQVITPAGGKLPSPVNLGVALQDCSQIDLTTGLYSLQITGAGLSLAAPNIGKCLITSSLTIDPSASAGPTSVILLNNKQPVGSADFVILDATAGPIPPGLAPQVDVMWEVMAQNNCSDTFGRRVAHSMYCIQVNIGNNSGHPILLAGVGFTKDVKSLEALGIKNVTIANSSYASTRAVLVHSQSVSARNIIYNSLQAAGLLMAGFTPYFSGVHQKNAKLHYITAIAIVTGPVLQAINLVAPDPIINQLKSLDDQSLRDNMIVPNNAPARTVVFVEKQALTLSLRETAARLTAAAVEMQKQADKANEKATTAENTAAAAQADATMAQDKATSAAEALATPPAGVQMEALQTKAETARAEAARLQTRGENAEATARTLRLQASSLAGQAQSLQQEASKADETITNSTRPGPFKSKGQFNPTLVKIALGDLVIVGEEIEYLQRIQMQGNAATPAVSVTVAPTTQKLMLGDQQKFTASVTGSTNTNVVWSLVDAQGATSTIGSLTSDGAYTAPSTMPTPNAVNVKATSAADSSKFASASVTIIPVSLGITPASATLGAGATQKFTAGTPNVKWTVTAGGGGKANGTIDGSGLYTAPSPLPAAGVSDTVTATSTVDATKTATATVTFH
jgi:hypothetical protein